MVTLLCFCCEHRNPAGARFCNACGTPLHLKPCKRCETINERAAAHCHHCGETFALEFATLDEAPQLPEPDAAPPPMADDPPRGTSAHRVRAYLLVGGVAAAAIAATWFGTQLSPPDAAVTASPALAAPPAGSTGDAPMPVRAKPADDGAVPVELAAELPDEPHPASDAMATAAASVPVGVPPASAPSRPPGAKPQPASPQVAVGPHRPQGSTRSRSATAAPPPADEPSRAPMIMAVERPAPAAQRRAPSERNVPSRPRGIVRVEPGTPCSEGYAPAPGCDFRTMPKGN